jgi:hypothetical protein
MQSSATCISISRENLDLEFKVFGHRLDHEIGARDRVRQTLVDRDLAARMVGDRERR